MTDEIMLDENFSTFKDESALFKHFEPLGDPRTAFHDGLFDGPLAVGTVHRTSLCLPSFTVTLGRSVATHLAMADRARMRPRAAQFVNSAVDG